MSELKQSINKLQICGELVEVNLVVDEKYEREINGSKYTGKAIVKNEFKNPSITINVNGNTIGVNFVPTFYKRWDNTKNELVDNSNYKALETLMGYEKGTRVLVDGQFSKNEYANPKNDYEISSLFQITSFGSASSSRATEDDYAEGKLSGVIRRVYPEMKGDDETGRLCVEFASFDHNLDMYSYDFMVDEELADAFNDLFETGDSANLEIEICTVQHGETQKKTTGFGRASKIKSGYTTTELKVIGGDVIEEENELYVPLDIAKNKVKERDVRWEQLKAKRKESETKPKTETKVSNFVPMDADDIPF